MPDDPRKAFDNQQHDEEYRRRTAARAKRRKQRRNQKLLLIGAFALAAIIVIVCFVFIIRAIFGKKTPVSSSVPSSTSISTPVSTPTGPGYSWPVAEDPSLWNLVLINRSKPMADGYNPELVIVSDLGHKFHASAAAKLTEMITACNAEGNSLQINSAHRGPQTQADKRQRVIDALLATMTQPEAVAMADQIEPVYPLSDHQTGLGVKFVTSIVNDTAQAFEQTPEYAWLDAHAHEYGFVLRFPQGKEAVTGILYQPYHWRYVGVEEAATMKQFGICLEEYLAQMPEAEAPALPDISDPASISGSGSGGTAGL